MGSLLSSALKSISANTISKITSIVNTTISDIGSSIGVKKGSVDLKLSDGSSGVSHACDLKSRMAAIEWSRGFSWDVHLSPAPPAPFNDTAYGIPVVSVDTNYSLMGVQDQIRASGTTYNFPSGKDLVSIKLTLMDDDKGTMEQYFEQWLNDVYRWNSDGGYVQYLDQSCRHLTLSKLDSLKREIFNRQYLVFPYGAVASMNNGSGGVRTFSIDLYIGGYLGKGMPVSVAKPTPKTPVEGVLQLWGKGSKANSILEAAKYSTTPGTIDILAETSEWLTYQGSKTIPDYTFGETKDSYLDSLLKISDAQAASNTRLMGYDDSEYSISSAINKTLGL